MGTVRYCGLLLLAACFIFTAQASARTADDMAVIRDHNSQAHLPALWHLGQPDTAANLTTDDAEALMGALYSEDWRVRWLAAEALAEYWTTADYGWMNRVDELLQTEPEAAVREACARAQLARSSAEGGGISRGCLAGLGDESALVRLLLQEHAGRIIVSNPGETPNLLSRYCLEDPDDLKRGIDWLESSVLNGAPEAQPGLELLIARKSEIAWRRHIIAGVFREHGEIVLPFIRDWYLSQPGYRGDIIGLLASMGPAAAGEADLLAMELADPGSAYRGDAHHAVSVIKPRGSLAVADAVMPLILVEDAQPFTPNLMKALGPLPDEYNEAIIQRIEAGVETRYNDLLSCLAYTGLESDYVLDYLTMLAGSNGYPPEQSQSAEFALARMAKQGNTAAARIVLDVRNEDKQLALARKIVYDKRVLDHPEIVRILLDSLDTVSLVLELPELATLPEYRDEVQVAILAAVGDTATPEWRVARLIPLLADDLTPPAGLGERLAARIKGSNSLDDGFFRYFVAHYPDLAFERYHDLVSSDNKSDWYQAIRIVNHLGPDAVKLLPDLGNAVILSSGSEATRSWLAGGKLEAQGTGRVISPEELEELHPLLFGCAVEQAGPGAAPYTRLMLYLLKRAYRTREQVQVPDSALDDPRQLDYARNRAYRNIDQEIDQLIRGLEAIGPAAVPDILAVARGALNDQPYQYGSTMTTPNRAYDRRLRMTCCRILGTVGTGDEKVARHLSSVLGTNVSGTGDGWFGYYSKEPGPEEFEYWGIVAGSLGRIGVNDDAVVMALLECAECSDPAVRRTAVEALRQLAGWEYPEV